MCSITRSVGLRRPSCLPMNIRAHRRRSRMHTGSLRRSRDPRSTRSCRQGEHVACRCGHERCLTPLRILDVDVDPGLEQTYEVRFGPGTEDAEDLRRRQRPCVLPWCSCLNNENRRPALRILGDLSLGAGKSCWKPVRQHAVQTTIRRHPSSPRTKPVLAANACLMWKSYYQISDRDVHRQSLSSRSIP